MKRSHGTVNLWILWKKLVSLAEPPNCGLIYLSNYWFYVCYWLELNRKETGNFIWKLLKKWYHFSLQQVMWITQGGDCPISAGWKHFQTMSTPTSWKWSKLSSFLPLHGPEYGQIWRSRCYTIESVKEWLGLLGNQQIWKLLKYGLTA